MKPKINFLCVGAQKSGTTSLHDILKQHPDVCLPLIKETHFFDENYEKGMEWYFDTYFSNYQGEKICGECTPEYMFFEEIPERLYNAFGPDVKLVFLLRNPVDRAVSHYQMSTKRTFETLPFEEAVRLEDSRIQTDNFHRSHFSYLSRGFYSDQIKRYLQFFPIENMLFLRFEVDFVKNRKRTMDEVCSFLGIDGSDLNVEIKSHVGKQPRYKWMPKFIYKPGAMKQLLSFLPHSLRAKIIKTGYYAALKEKNPNLIPADLRNSLMDRYKSEIAETLPVLNLKSVSQEAISFFDQSPNLLDDSQSLKLCSTSSANSANVC